MWSLKILFSIPYINVSEIIIQRTLSATNDIVRAQWRYKTIKQLTNLLPFRIGFLGHKRIRDERIL